MDIERRARRYAALGDPLRLRIIIDLARSDRSPRELEQGFDLPSNLLAHHLDVLERAGLIARSRSEGDKRRVYVRAIADVPAGLGISLPPPPERVLFVCTHNSARSQFAAALWTRAFGGVADSAGTHPAARIHPGAVAAADRADLALAGTRPKHLDEVSTGPELVVTVCDRAHEELHPPAAWWHWSVGDPVTAGTPSAFDAALSDIDRRISALAEGDRARWN